MKKLIFIPLLIFSLTLSAQFTKSGGTFLKSGNAFMTATVPPIDSANWHADYKTVYYAIPLSDRPGIDTADLQNTMVERLDTCGAGATSVWDRKDLFYCFAQKTNDGAEINWDNPGTFDINDGDTITFTKYKGYTGATGDYLNTGYRPEQDKIHISVNSTTIGFYASSTISSLSTQYAMGVLGTYSLYIVPYYEGYQRVRLNNGTTTVSGEIASVLGMHLATRRAESELETYLNGDHLADGTTASLGLPTNRYLAILALNSAGTYTGYYLGEISLVIVCDALTDDEADDVSEIIEDYMTAIGNGL